MASRSKSPVPRGDGGAPPKAKDASDDKFAKLDAAAVLALRSCAISSMAIGVLTGAKSLLETSPVGSFVTFAAAAAVSSSIASSTADAAANTDLSGDIDEKRKELSKARKGITVFKAPLTTARNFGVIFKEWAQDFGERVINHSATKFVCFVLLPLWFAAKQYDAGAAVSLTSVEQWLSYSVWWVLLGVLSSVGFGSGLHSGMLYMFPHIYLVVSAAEKCGGGGFTTIDNRWCLPSFAKVGARLDSLTP